MLRKILIPSLALLLSLTDPARATEEILTGPAIQTLLSENVFIGQRYDQQTEQIYRASGDTFYSEGGNQSQGRWDVRGNEYCSVWPPSTYWSCYAVAKNDDDIIFIAKNGTRSTSRRRE